MYIIWVVQRLGAAPYNSKCGIGGGGSCGIRKLHVVTVDGVTQQVGIDTCHTALNVELTHKSCLGNELLCRERREKYEIFALINQMSSVKYFYCTDSEHRMLIILCSESFLHFCCT